MTATTASHHVPDDALPETFRPDVAIVGLGLRRTAAGDDLRRRRRDRARHRRRPVQAAARAQRHELDRGRPERATSPTHVEAGRFLATDRLRRRSRGRRGHHRGADPAQPQPRARPGPRRGGDALDRAAPAAGPARRARVDDLAGHDPRDPAADPRAGCADGARRDGRRRLPPRLLARARRPGQRDVDHQATRRRSSAASRPPAPSRPWRSTRARSTRCTAVSAPEAAELEKLFENIFRNVNIALVNELAMLCDRMGIDVWEVIDAAATKPFGFMKFTPGSGPRRPLHPDRPLLPRLEGARVRLLDRVHRARRQDQLEHALPLRAQGAQGAGRARQGPARRARAGARRRLQERHHRLPRELGDQDPRAAAEARRRRRLPRPVRAGDRGRPRGRAAGRAREPLDRADRRGAAARRRRRWCITDHSNIDWDARAASTRRSSSTSATSTRDHPRSERLWKL